MNIIMDDFHNLAQSAGAGAGAAIYTNCISVVE